MRRRPLVIIVAVVLAALVVGLVVSRGRDDDGTAPPEVPGLESKEVDAGPVTVEVTPVQLDKDGAAFRVTFDNHVMELDMDLPAQAGLTVDGTVWPARDWSGDAPGGHHREGELTFDPAGPATGTVRLTIDGLPEPVEITWTSTG